MNGRWGLVGALEPNLRLVGGRREDESRTLVGGLESSQGTEGCLMKERWWEKLLRAEAPGLMEGQ